MILSCSQLLILVRALKSAAGGYYNFMRAPHSDSSMHATDTLLGGSSQLSIPSSWHCVSHDCVFPGLDDLLQEAASSLLRF